MSATQADKAAGSHLEQAIALHRRLRVAAGYFEYYGYDSLFKPGGAAQCDLEKLDDAHVRVFGIALANGSAGYFQVGPNDLELAGDQDWAYRRLLDRFDAALADVRRCPRVRIVQRASDLDADRGDDTIAVIPLVTGHAWMRDLAAIDELFRRGLRISHAASISCAIWCRSCPQTTVRGRLAPAFTEFGRQVVARMNELGIVLDTAHMTDASAAAVIAASTRPVMDGHTGSRSAVPESRGLSDATIRLIAEGGGVVGIHFADHMWTRKVWGRKYFADSGAQPHPLWAYNRDLLARVSDPNERMRLRKDGAAQRAFFEKHNLAPPPPAPTDRIATVADMADHVEHLVHVAGIECVGLGGDVNGITGHSWPAGVDHVGELPHLTAELLRRGYSEEDLTRFLSTNWLRVFRAALPA